MEKLTGHEGIEWIAVQAVLFVALLGSPLLVRDSFWPVVIGAGAALMFGALAWMVYAYRSLGDSHSPWVAPIARGRLAATRAYGIVRHPIYAGWITLALGWGILTSSALVLGLSVLLALFYDRRARYEEHLLERAYPDYRTYRQRVKRFLPGIY